jgi:alcohol dehydrogenase
MPTRKSTNTMKAWRFESASGRLVLEEVPVPTLRPGAVFVRMQATPVLSYMGDVLAGKLTTYRFPPRPFTPGTNGTGTVESIGPEIFHVRAGQRVVLNPHFVVNERTPSPEQILIGLHRIGPDSAPVQDTWPDGSFAEYALMPASVVTPITGDVAPERLATLGKFAVPYGGLSQIGFQAGETLIVNGATGYFGSAAALLGLAMGAARVIAAGRDAATLGKLASILGARGITIALSGDSARDTAELREAANGGADAAIDLVGRATDPGSTVATLRALRRGGRLALMGSMTAPLPLAYGEIMINDLTIVGRFMYPPDALARLAVMAASGMLDLSAVDVTSFPLDQLPAALTHAAAMRGLEATVLTM